MAAKYKNAPYNITDKDRDAARKEEERRKSEMKRSDEISPEDRKRLDSLVSGEAQKYNKGGMVKKAPAKMAKGGIMCSPRKKMAMGKGYKAGGAVRRSGC